MEKDFSKYQSIKDMRNYLGLTQDELGKILRVKGVYISQIENGKRPLTFPMAQKFGLFLERIARKRKWTRDDDYYALKDRLFDSTYKDLMYNHEYSFYPPEVRDRLFILTNIMNSAKNEIDLIKKHRRLVDQDDDIHFFPPEDDIHYRLTDKSVIFEEVISRGEEAKNIIKLSRDKGFADLIPL